ncbi:hypothetical protein ASE04_28955 [Rhizobium sp. Root708]|uniref:metallophosphoesterase n=1 Tax=Rhizobium sp. Root708 TaxID=1736592 RepID=UPI0006F2FCD3|nr:metallophosphoesterase [Rhizobium sp. Root708]KRB56184.1 hypothetical protein ASE04_28955 [Rhizobium sp. Root708]
MNDLHTFAIGDVHGRADLLAGLLTDITTRSAAAGWPFRVVFLGDIIDRGPMSLAALRLVHEHLAEFPESVLIRGNHDWFPTRILDEIPEDQQARFMNHWIVNMGGEATIRAMGYLGDEFSVEVLREFFPAEYLDMIRNAKTCFETEEFIFVHAGVSPGIPLPQQKPYDLMWITEPFLSLGGAVGKPIIHGHTITESRRPEIYLDRIAIDTGAYDSDNLTAFHFDPVGSLEFLSSTFHGVQTVEPILLETYEDPYGVAGGHLRQ